MSGAESAGATVTTGAARARRARRSPPPKEKPHEPARWQSPAVLPPPQDVPVLRRQCAEDRLQGRATVAALCFRARQDRTEPHHRSVGKKTTGNGQGDQACPLPGAVALRDP